MPDFHIGKYTYSCIIPNYYYLYYSYQQSEKAYIETCDRKLHQSLDKIIRERCSSISSSSSSQIEKFRCDPQYNIGCKSIIKLILEQEPALSKYFSKEELKKLSLLWISVLVGYEKSAELLVRAGADVNELFGRRDPQVIDEKWTILHVLIQMGTFLENHRLIRLVVDLGADLQARDYRGRTALHLAIEQNLVQITEMLLEKGAVINVADNEGMTPLLVAVGKLKANELVPLLVKHGADIFAKDIHYRNALHHLAYPPYVFVEHVETARVLIDRGISLDDRTHHDWLQPIHDAARTGKNELVKLFLDQGADVNARAKDGVLPVHLAAECNDPEVLLTLLRRGANVDAKTDAIGQTALHKACSGGLMIKQENKIKILLSAGADIFTENHYGLTPFGSVIRFETRYDPKFNFMLRTLALKKASLQSLIELKDEQLIKPIAMMWNYYQDCHVHISKAKATSIVGFCTIFELLTKCHCCIAGLMWNRDFESQFELCDVNGFSMYAEDILEAFEGAQNHYQSVLEQVDILNEAVYYMLPHMIVRKVVQYMLDCDSCQMKINRSRVLGHQ